MTEDESREQRFTGSLPPIRQGYTKITSWSEIDFTLPDVREKLYKAYLVMARHLRAQEQAQLDLTTRPLPWQHLIEQNRYQCDVPPHRIVVSRIDDSMFWQGALESADQDTLQGPVFKTLEAALTWGEQKLNAAAADTARTTERVVASTPARLTLETLTAAHRERLLPFWIAPQDLAQLPVIYRVSIRLILASRGRQRSLEPAFLERSFGEHRFEDVYPTPAQLADDLRINRAQFDLEPSANGFLYRVISLTTYRDLTIATAQAQHLWDQSTIAAAVRDGYALGAVYGIEEIESGWHLWIGGCGNWPEQPKEREAYLAWEAFNLTLIHALDLAGYRARLAVPHDVLSDAMLYEIMHEKRAASSAIPPAARAESVQWLHEHRTAETPFSHAIHDRK